MKLILKFITCDLFDENGVADNDSFDETVRHI